VCASRSVPSTMFSGSALIYLGILTSFVHGLNDAGGCNALGCEPNVAVYYGTTSVTEFPTSQPPYVQPANLPKAQLVLGDSGGLVTWAITNPTTIAVPRPTAASGIKPGIIWTVSTSTITQANVAFTTPYLAKVTSDPCPTPPPVTVQAPPVTVLVTTTQLYCPPPPCEHRVFVPWTSFTAGRAGDGSILPKSISISAPASAWLTVIDAEYKLEKYTVTLNGQILGETSDFTPDKKQYCNPNQPGEQCIDAGFSNGKWPIPAGTHTVTFYTHATDLGYTSFTGRYKLEENCD